MKKLFFIITMSCCLLCVELKAQYSQGSTGLLTIPSAQMQPDGTFMAGFNFMPQEITPSAWDYNTANYFLNITILPFVEVGYLCTLFHFADNSWNQDRALSVRLRPLKEDKWYPSIVIGSNDILTTSQNGNILETVNSNRYYSTIYGVATKHFSAGGGTIGLTIGYGYKTQENSFKDGLFYGISYSPSFYSNATIMADVNANIVSIGAAAKLFNHLSISAFCYDFRAFVGGLRYEVELY